MLTRFEELPVNVRALILAKLAAEMKSAKADSIYHLARMQRSDVHGLWRVICRKAAQPVCTMPIGVFEETEFRRNLEI
jgi:invasion protein IalB